jgi:hypothetical protein
MADSETAYRYTVPLVTEDGVESPAYDSALDREKLYAEYAAGQYVFVCEESVPHFHKKSVNVSVEEVETEQINGAN